MRFPTPFWGFGKFTAPLLLFLFAAPARAMRGSSTDLVSPSTVAEFFSFDYAATPSAPGLFNASLLLDPSASTNAFVWGFLCSDGELERLLGMFDTAEALCAFQSFGGLCRAVTEPSLN